jgi:hypothetical protein
MDSLLKADSAAGVEDAAFAIGDLAYQSGTAREFTDCWGTSWGDSTRRIMKVIRPAVGNHEYSSTGAAPYFAYFGARAGDPQKGYYGYDLGEWRILVLNSEIPMNSLFSLEDRTAQEDWLRAEFKDRPPEVYGRLPAPGALQFRIPWGADRDACTLRRHVFGRRRAGPVRS